MKTLLNYLGEIRLYSIADLILLLVAIRTPFYPLVGAVVLHLSFISYLESIHSHSYRPKVPVWVSYILGIIGLLLYGKIEGIFYLLTSYLYTQKTKKLGGLSPLFRAVQNLFIVAGIPKLNRGFVRRAHPPFSLCIVFLFLF